MKARLAFALAVLAFGSAFAPAPFPRPGRGNPNAIDQARFQGTWAVVSFEIVQQDGSRNRLADWGSSGTTAVRVEGDRWTYLNGQLANSSYLLSIDPGPRPAAINWYVGQQKEKPGMLGIIRREGDRVVILYYAATTEAQRPRGFDHPPPGWWILTLRRGG